MGEGQVIVWVGDDGRWQEQADPSGDHYGRVLMDELMTSVGVQWSGAGTTVVLKRQLPTGPDAKNRRNGERATLVRWRVGRRL